MADLKLLKRLRILLIDDHPFIVNTISDLLEAANFQTVDKAMSAEEALLKFENNTYDLIITDIEMGKMNGLELIKLIRTGQTSAKPNTRIIVLTSHSNETVLGVAMALDMNGFLVKPMRLNQVVEKINSAVAESFKARPAFVYQVIPTNLGKTEVVKIEEKVSETENIVTGTILTSPTDDRNSRMGIEVQLSDLKEGMIIFDSVMTKTSSVLLKKGHKMTKSNIARLHDLMDVLNSEFVTVEEGFS